MPMSYQDTVITLAEAGDLSIIDAELAAQELLVGSPCKACGLPLGIAEVEGITCGCPIEVF
jgi:hypothetical protein